MPQLHELSIEVTNECLMGCLHCSSGSIPAKQKNELSIMEHIGLLCQAKELGAKVVSLSGGEPLLYEHLPYLVNKATGMFDKVLIYTTGHSHDGTTIGTYKHIDELLSYGVTWIFSLHSHRNLCNDHIMNHDGAWDAITWSIDWLTHICDANVEVHMVPMAYNYNDVSDVCDQCSKYGVNKLSLLRFVPQTRGHTNRDELSMTKSQFSELQYIMDKSQRMYAGALDLRLGCPIDFRHAVGLVPQKVKPCHAGDDLMLVRPDGSVHPCAAWKTLSHDGNVRSQKDLAWIWEHSSMFTAIREFKDHGYNEVEMCRTCPHFHTCKGGCIAQRLHAYGKQLSDIYQPWSDPLCPRGITPDMDIEIQEAQWTSPVATQESELVSE